MSGKHTPGPWRLEDPLGPDTLSIVAGSSELQVHEWPIVADVGLDEAVNGIPAAEARANARLIAAAPALADALEAMVADHRRIYGAAWPEQERVLGRAADCPCELCDSARAALRAAGRGDA